MDNAGRFWEVWAKSVPATTQMSRTSSVKPSVSQEQSECIPCAHTSSQGRRLYQPDKKKKKKIYLCVCVGGGVTRAWATTEAREGLE